MNHSSFVKKIGGLLFAAALMVAAQAVFAGGTAEKKATASPVNLTVWTMLTVSSQLNGLKQEVAAFEKEHPNVHATVQPVSFNDVYQRLLTAGRSGQVPDVFNCNETMVAFMQARNEIQPVDSVVTALGGPSKFVGHYLQWESRNGHYWAVPDWALHEGVYYRKNLFKKYDIAIPKTWDGLLAAAKKLNLTRPNGARSYGMGVPLGKNLVAQQSLAPLLYSEGVHIFDPKTGKYQFGSDRAKVVKSINFLVKLYKTASPQASIDWSWGDYRNAFVQGVTNMTYGWGATVLIAMKNNPKLLPNIGLFPFPSGPDMSSYPPTSQPGSGYFFTISKNSKARFSDAQKLVEFLFQKKRAAARANERPIFALPAYKPALSDYYAMKIPSEFKPIIHTIDTQILPYEYPQGLEAGLNPVAGEIESSNIFGSAIHNVLLNGWTADHAFTWLNGQLKSMIKKFN